MTKATEKKAAAKAAKAEAKAEAEAEAKAAATEKKAAAKKVSDWYTPLGGRPIAPASSRRPQAK